MGNTSKLEEGVVRVVTRGDPSTGVSALRREPVGPDEGRGSMIVPNAVAPVGESIREPVVVVSTERG